MHTHTPWQSLITGHILLQISATPLCTHETVRQCGMMSPKRPSDASFLFEIYSTTATHSVEFNGNIGEPIFVRGINAVSAPGLIYGSALKRLPTSNML